MNKLEYAIIAGIVLVGIILLYNFFTSQALSQELDKKIEEAKKASILPKITVMLITSECEQCSDLSNVVGFIQQLDVNATIKEITLENAKDVISQYSITKLPAIVVEGNTSVVESSQVGQLFSKRSGALVMEAQPPYYDLKERSVRGIVNIILIEANDCNECFDFIPVIRSLRSSLGMSIGNVEQLSYEEGQNLIQEYGIDALPTVLLDKEADLYGFQGIAQQNPNLIEVREDYYILKPFPPYQELPSMRIKGTINITFLLKEDCDECMSIDQFRNVFNSLGIYYVDREVNVDSDEGKEIIERYNITFVPNYILSGDIEVYNTLPQVLNILGHFVNDSAVFDNKTIFPDGVFYSLEKNKTLEPEIRVIEVEGSEFQFNPSRISVKEGERIRIVFKNVGTVPHDFVIEELGIRTNVIQPGQTDSVEFVAQSTGTLTFYCSVGGHRGLGMEGNIEVEQ